MRKRFDPREVDVKDPEKANKLKKIAELYDKNEKEIHENYNIERESCQNMLDFHGHGFLDKINASWCQLFSNKNIRLEKEQRELEQQAEAIIHGNSTVKM